ncbi:MAG: GNAT family N-acetyltransferase [Candidatus Dormibacteraeota bacterium]|nr:GNAT family N-acetyltransferase [Candidatus Dormibacteraeota bacterium]
MATAADRISLAGLRWRWRVEERGEQGMDRESFIAAFVAWAELHESTHTAFVAEAGDNAAGMAWLNTFHRIPGPQRWDRRAGNVQSVYVLPQWRNRGVGALLMHAVIAEARTAGLEYLAVHIADRAEQFYRRLGFIQRDDALELDLRGEQR